MRTIPLVSAVLAIGSFVGCGLSAMPESEALDESEITEGAIAVDRCPDTFDFVVEDINVADHFDGSDLGPAQIDQVNAVRNALREVTSFPVSLAIRRTATTSRACRYEDPQHPFHSLSRLASKGRNGALLTAQTDIVPDGQRVRLVAAAKKDTDGRFFVEGGTATELFARIVYTGGSDAAENYIAIGTARVSTLAGE